MVIFWNFAGVPFVSVSDFVWFSSSDVPQSYVYSVVYMASHDPSAYRFSTLGYIVIYTTLVTAYYMWVLSRLDRHDG